MLPSDAYVEAATGPECLETRQYRLYPNRPAAAAKVLAALLDKLRSASASGRRGGLALVRMTTADDAPGG